VALVPISVFGLSFAASQFMSMQHDEPNMPILNGVDMTESEVSELKALFQNLKDITRSVELLPNGIKL
jgi:hypothetical protein